MGRRVDRLPPGSLGQLTVNALVAAAVALLVTEPRASSVDGLASIVRTIATVRQHLPKHVEVIVATLRDVNTHAVPADVA